MTDNTAEVYSTVDDASTKALIESEMSEKNEYYVIPDT